MTLHAFHSCAVVQCEGIFQKSINFFLKITKKLGLNAENPNPARNFNSNRAHHLA